MRQALVKSLLHRPAWAALLLLVTAASSGRAASTAAPEDRVKAAALYNVIAFTTWPADAFATPDAPFVIGVLGDGPVAELVEPSVRGESWHGHPFVVEHFRDAAHVTRCQVLYVGRLAKPDWPRLRRQLAGTPILAISDTDRFAADGGAVQLSIENNKLQIVINLAVTQTNHIRLSSNLLRLATIVGPTADPIHPHSRNDVATPACASVCLAMLN